MVREPSVTSRMMASVKNKNSKAEVALRKELHAYGLRFRLHPSNVFGRPDIVWRQRKIAVFVDGDFWHGNAWKLRGLSCLGDLFPSRRDWWVQKIRRTQERDQEVNSKLLAEGWTVIRLWESEILASPQAAARKVEQARRNH
jgi:DNA mismatch endonuclease, patch repair protein